MIAPPTPTPHPCLPVFSEPEMRAILARPQGVEELSAWYNDREELIRRAERDPLNYGFEPSYVFENGERVHPWNDADRLFLPGMDEMDTYLLAIFGGNRAMKSFYAAKRLCQCIRFFPGVYVALAEKETTSIAQQQKILWHYLAPHYAHINGKRDPNRKYSVNYSPAGGFADRKAVFPNGSELYLFMYSQVAGDYEGWEYGARKETYQRIAAERRAAGLFVPPNVGAWADESLTMAFLEMFARRLPFTKAKLLWTFTPVSGITPAVKEFVGQSAATLKALPSVLLPRQNLPDLLPGEMPYIQKTALKGSRAVYFFSIFNPFHGYYGEIVNLCSGRVSEYVERVAYGYARDSVARAFGSFGPWNVVKRKHLPATGTNYQFTDPAGVRNWATLWVRVTPGNPPSYYVYRDWPDAARHGEWAVTTERQVNEDNRKGWDGDSGPAQNPTVAGILPYKRLFLAEEKINVPLRILTMAEAKPEGQEWSDIEWVTIEAELVKQVVDPHHRAEIRRAVKENGLAELHERLRARYIDPRAGRNEQQAERGGTCLIDELAKENRDSAGRVLAERMHFIPASGVDIQEGIVLINELLDWDRSQPLVPPLNAPRLFVSDNCQQVIWALSNYTGRGGETGACKDFVDILRYMVLAKLRHIEPGMVKVLGGGAY